MAGHWQRGDYESARVVSQGHERNGRVRVCYGKELNNAFVK